jgi:hypothetical protein
VGITDESTNSQEGGKKLKLKIKKKKHNINFMNNY